MGSARAGRYRAGGFESKHGDYTGGLASMYKHVKTALHSPLDDARVCKQRAIASSPSYPPWLHAAGAGARYHPLP